MDSHADLAIHLPEVGGSGAAVEEVTTMIHHHHTRLVARQDRNLHPAHHAVRVRLTAVLVSGLEPALVLQEAIWLAST